MGFDPISFLLGSKSGGGGQPASSPWTKIAEQDFTVSTSSTTDTTVGEISVSEAAWTSAKMIWVRVRDKAGPKDGHYYGCDCFLANSAAAGSGTLQQFLAGNSYYLETGEQILSVRGSGASYGVYPYRLKKSDYTLTVNSRYSTLYGTIDGTYHVEVYTLEWPDNISPFA